MKVIVPCNNKGGVGKTCLSAILADYFSKMLKKRVLLIDLDPQCNLSQRFIEMDVDPNNPDGHMPPQHPDFLNEDPSCANWSGRSSIADIFLHPNEGVVPYPTLNDHLDIIPAHAADLLTVEQCRKEDIVDKIHNRFEQFLWREDVISAYDYVIIDTAPSKGALTRSAMRAASHIIIPSPMEDKPIRGVFGIMQLWMQERKRRTDSNPLNLIGILPNMFDSRTALHAGMYEDLKSNRTIAAHLIPHKLSRRITFAENDTEVSSPKSLFDLPSSNKAKQECITLCEYVTTKINKTEVEVV
jgi:chromosome partitioning protein